MTLKELEEQLGVPRAVALRLARMIPGAKKEAGGPGQIPRWVIPDDALQHLTEEMLEAARVEPSPATAASPGDPGLVEEERAVKRARLAADQTRAEADRLKAEADRVKAEEDLARLRDRRGPTTPEPALSSWLLDRLDRLERAVQDGAHPDPMAPMAEMVITIMAPLIEKLAAQPSPAPTQPSLPDLLGIVEKVRSLAGPPEEVRRELRATYRAGLEDGMARAGVGTGEGASAWADVLHSLPEMIRTGQELGLLRPPAMPAVMPPPASAPTMPTGASAPVTAGGPAASPPASAPGSPPPGPSGIPAGPQADQLPTMGAILFLLRRAVETEKSGGPSYEAHSLIVDEHLPGFLDEWATLDQDQALQSLATVDPFFAQPTAQEWLRRWWRFLREEYLVEEEPGPKANDEGERR